MAIFFVAMGILGLAIYLSNGDRVSEENPSKKFNESLALFLYFVALPVYLYLVS
jgi:hypothetical protein